MLKVGGRVASALVVALIINSSLIAQAQRESASSPATRRASEVDSSLTGVYRLDPSRSDKLYSVVSSADTNLPFGKQQRFFDDLTIRLSSPDQLAIERRGRRIDIASSRAPRVTIEADGRERTERLADGYTVRTRAALQGDQLVVSSNGSASDQFKVSFEPIDNGSRLRVTRTIYAEQLNQPIVVQSIYDKVSRVARWDIYGEPQSATTKDEVASASPARPDPAPAATARATAEGDQAAVLRGELGEWVAATNARDIRKQMTFYMPRVRAFYLARNVSREAVRAEKARVFARADTIDVRAAEPEIIFRDAGRTAIMRFRKQYVIGGPRSRRGEVIQELRWQQTGDGWKIFSERDVKVIR